MNISGRQLRKRQATIDSLKATFVALILKYKSVEPITVKEITDLADFNRSTFYSHFQDKFELLDTLYENTITQLYNTFKLPYKDTDQLFMSEASPSTMRILQHIEKNQDLYRALDIANVHPNLYEGIEQMLFKLYTEEILLVLEDPSEIEYEIFLKFQISATLGVIKYWIKKDYIYSADHMSKQLASFPLQKVIGMKLKK